MRLYKDRSPKHLCANDSSGITSCDDAIIQGASTADAGRLEATMYDVSTGLSCRNG